MTEAQADQLYWLVFIGLWCVVFALGALFGQRLVGDRP